MQARDAWMEMGEGRAKALTPRELHRAQGQFVGEGLQRAVFRLALIAER